MLSKTAVIVLAAGLSRRFGSGDKLMAPLHGRPVIAHALDTVRSLGAGQRLVVVRPGSHVPALAPDFDIVTNPEPSDGMGRSIALGIGAVRSDMDAVLIALGDMPAIGAEAYKALAVSPADIAVPVYGGMPGHPVLFRRPCFAQLECQTGDTGAKGLIASGRFSLDHVPLPGTGGLTDIDTPDDLQNDAFRQG